MKTLNAILFSSIFLLSLMQSSECYSQHKAVNRSIRNSDANPPKSVPTFIEPVMILIPFGSFKMGTSLRERDNLLLKYAHLETKYPQQGGWLRKSFEAEMPQHEVYLSDFRIATTPVTVAEYKLYCQAKHKKMPPAPQFNKDWRKANHPIVNICFNDARDYCIWLSSITHRSYRLPTEAEWEKVARGKMTNRRFPWGNTFNAKMLRFAQAPYSLTGGTAPVATHPANGYGVYDMVGNVWQWCSDWYDEAYYKNSPKQNPTGPSHGEFKVIRGGSFADIEELRVRCAYRWRDNLDDRQVVFGFRCAMSINSGSKSSNRK